MAATFSTLATAAGTATTSCATSAAATPLGIGEAVVGVAKWHVKIGQEWDDQDGKDSR
jgi:hypothetical protein